MDLTIMVFYYFFCWSSQDLVYYAGFLRFLLLFFLGVSHGDLIQGLFEYFWLLFLLFLLILELLPLLLEIKFLLLHLFLFIDKILFQIVHEVQFLRNNIFIPHKILQQSIILILLLLIIFKYLLFLVLHFLNRLNIVIKLHLQLLHLYPQHLNNTQILSISPLQLSNSPLQIQYLLSLLLHPHLLSMIFLPHVYNFILKILLMTLQRSILRIQVFVLLNSGQLKWQNMGLVSLERFGVFCQKELGQILEGGFERVCYLLLGHYWVHAWGFDCDTIYIQQDIRQVHQSIQEMNGIIVPPGAIKQTIDKTAFYVAKNGSQFEKALIQMEQNKPQFAFLRKDNPYRAFYDHMVAEYSKKMMAGTEEVQPHGEGEVKEEVAKIQKEIQEKEGNKQQAEFLEKVFEEVKEPEPDKYSAEVPEKLSRAEMAMIQHTAQYVAINGKNFLIALSERQKNNPQFQFLRSSSENHEYFTKIVAAYTFILQLGDEEKKKLQENMNNRQSILNRCKEAHDYFLLKQEKNKNSKQNADQKKQSNVDWNDFQLVETIVFDDLKPKKGFNDEFKLSKPLFSSKNMEEKILSEPKKKQLLQICHVCKRNILASEMTKHLKTCLGAKNNNNKPTNGQTSNEGGSFVDVSKNLENMSLRRPDIFGGESQGIRKDDDKKEEERVVWDGQAPNISRTTASIAMLHNEQKKIREQLSGNK